MQYGLIQIEELKTENCLVVGIFEEQTLPESLSPLDKALKGLIQKLGKKLEKAGDLLWRSDAEDPDLLLIHCGKQEKYQAHALSKRLGEISEQLLKQGVSSAAICMPQLSEQSANKQVEHMLLECAQHSYQLLDFKQEKTPHKLKSIRFYLPNAEEQAINTAEKLANAVHFTRTLGNLPANVCTPSYLAEKAQQMDEQHGSVQCKILGLEAIKTMKMGAFLAVAQGSEQEPRFIELQYRGKETNEAPIVLVGKGITFDSGGISLKPASSMEEMKYDMLGAGSVLGTIKACALLELPIHVVGLIPAAENMVSGKAVKPGDIVTSLSGQSIEITNTDAEGRLILADALTYAERFKPEFVVDIATLTGAMVIALGAVNTGFMTQDDKLAADILKASEESRDKAWRMPLEDDYQSAMDSQIADMVNASSDRAAGSVTAACFLSRFSKKYRWAHLDIAGSAWKSGKTHLATGRPVPLLTQLLRQQVNES